MTRFHVLPHPLSVLVVTGLALAGLVLPPSPVAAAPADPASVSPVASGPAQDGSTASPTRIRALPATSATKACIPNNTLSPRRFNRYSRNVRVGSS